MVWALREAGTGRRADLALDSDVPDGAGLSSSAALECVACWRRWSTWPASTCRPSRWPGSRSGPRTTTSACRPASWTRRRRRCARPGHALFLDCRSLDIEHIPFDLGRRGLAILVVDTRAPHQHADGEYAGRRRSCEEAAAALGVAALRDVDVDDLPAALAELDDELPAGSGTWSPRTSGFSTRSTCCADGDVRDIGPLMTASHVSHA